MKCLTSKELDKWLSRHGHSSKADAVPVISFHAPTKFSALEAFVECILRDVFIQGEVLLMVEDTDIERIGHLRVIEGLRKLADEKRALDKSPGFLFAKDEWEHAITLFSLNACFNWRCYMWGDRDQLTLFNFEGEIFDVWAGDEKGRKAVLELLKGFKLKRIIRRSKSRGK
jgi:hypothetical protein